MIVWNPADSLPTFVDGGNSNEGDVINHFVATYFAAADCEIFWSFKPVTISRDSRSMGISNELDFNRDAGNQVSVHPSWYLGVFLHLTKRKRESVRVWDLALMTL